MDSLVKQMNVYMYLEEENTPRTVITTGYTSRQEFQEVVVICHEKVTQLYIFNTYRKGWRGAVGCTPDS